MTEAPQFRFNSELSDAASEAELAECAELLQQVEIQTDRAEGRLRQITARIVVPHLVEQIWQILTDYDRLAEFVPNLSSSQCIPHPSGGIRLEQVGTQNFFKLKFCARVVLDMVEKFPDRLEFHLVEGDFKRFEGCWRLQPLNQQTELSYTLLVLPPRTMPITLIERRLHINLAKNLVAIRQRAETLFGTASPLD